MRKKNKIYSVLTLLLTTALCFSTTACSQTRQPAEPTPAQEETTVQEPSVPEPETEAAKDTVPETETEPSTAALFSRSGPETQTPPFHCRTVRKGPSAKAGGRKPIHGKK